MEIRRFVAKTVMIMASCALLAVSPVGFGMVDENGVEAEAASGKVAISSKKLALNVGKKKVIKLKNASGSVKWFVGNKKVAKITEKKNKYTIKLMV